MLIGTAVRMRASGLWGRRMGKAARSILTLMAKAITLDSSYMIRSMARGSTSAPRILIMDSLIKARSMAMAR
jgi:hypothetical protein